MICFRYFTNSVQRLWKGWKRNTYFINFKTVLPGAMKPVWNWIWNIWVFVTCKTTQHITHSQNTNVANIQSLTATKNRKLTSFSRLKVISLIPWPEVHESACDTLKSPRLLVRSLPQETPLCPPESCVLWDQHTHTLHHHYTNK